MHQTSLGDLGVALFDCVINRIIAQSPIHKMSSSLRARIVTCKIGKLRIRCANYEFLRRVIHMTEQTGR